jgi:two-component system, NtrC family, sensor kinase
MVGEGATLEINTGITYILRIGGLLVKPYSLRARFMILFFIFFFVPYGLLTLFSVSASRVMMKKGTMDHLENLVEVKETAIEQWIKERVSDGKSIAASQEVRSLDPKRIEPFLSLVKHFERAYLEIWVVNLRGHIVSGNLSGASFEKAEWFQKAIEEETFILSPTPQPRSSRPVLTISFSIRDGKGRPIGVLKELVDLRYVSELISESKLGETGNLYIVNPQGELILHSKSTRLFGKEAFKVPYFEKNEFKPTYTGVYRDYAGSEVLGSWKWIQNLRCYLIAEQDTGEAFYKIRLLVKEAFLIFVISTLLILGTSYWVVQKVTGPIKRLSDRIASLAEGHFGETVQTTRRDEVGKLINGFNVMAGKLKKAYATLEGRVDTSNKELEVAYETLKQRQEQLIQSEKMAALGQLSAGIAHEIRTPLTSIKIFIQSLEKEIDLDENQREDFRIIMKEIDRINENITRFLNFARPDEPQFQLINLSLLVKETVNLLAAKLKSGDIRLELSLPDEPPPLKGDPKQLTQVFLNLLLNAVEAMPKGGTLTIESAVENQPRSGHRFLKVVIKDTGHGISEKDRPHLFDPFFTKKAGGTGIGLSIVYSIIQKHNGLIEVESESGKGSSFILQLPI